MEVFHFISDYLLKVDHHLEYVFDHYGFWVYILLFLIVFCETGLVVTPFLPGDALLFAVGALAARPGYLKIETSIALLIVAAFMGNVVNYSIGRRVGSPLFHEKAIILKKKYLESAEIFFAKHGGKAVILSRFLPILRTLVPFVAGMGRMSYQKFLFFNAIGATVWVVSMTLGGWFFGNIPIIKGNFEFAVIGIVFLSLIPVAWETFSHWRQARRNNAQKTIKPINSSGAKESSS